MNRLNKIPNNWKQTKVNDYTNSIVPGRNKPKIFNGDIPWITTPDLKNKTIYASRDNLCVTLEELKLAGGKTIPRNSVIMTCVGEFGIVSIAKREVVINQQLHAFVCKEGLDYNFLYYTLLFQKPFMEKISTKTAVPYLNKTNCESIPIPLPPLPEQKKIAEILSCWDKSIEQTEKLLRKGNESIKNQDGKWSIVNLGELANIVMGQSPPSSSYNESGEGLPLVGGNADIRDRREAPRTWTSEPRKIAEAGDLLLTVRAPVGHVARTHKKVCLGRGVCALQVVNADKDFLYHLLIHLEDSWSKVQQGSTFDAVNSKDLFSFSLSIPTTIKAQRDLGNVFSSLTSDIEKMKKISKSLIIQKKSLMQHLLTGKTRVKIPQ
jgi:type I restriction enzyme, S subunit